MYNKKEYQKQWRDTHKQYLQDYRRKWNSEHQVYKKEKHYKSHYNLTLQDIEEMLIKCENMCPICNTNITIKNSAIDHDHSTGKIRGILCRRCNKGLGHFKDNSQVLIKASEYLEKSSKKKETT